MKPLVSIITVTKNIISAGRKDFFIQCVESVKSQDYPYIEHIILDGASTDETLTFFNELKIKYISEPDTGIYNAFNKAIYLATGEYILFLNSDDFFCSNRAVSLSVEALLDSKADFSYATARIISDEYEFLMVPRWRACFTGTPFSHQTMLTSKKMLIDLQGFDERYRLYADYDLILRAIFSGYRSVCVQDCISSFRLGGISSQMEKKVIQEMIDVIEKNCNLCRKDAVNARRYSFLPFYKVRELLKNVVDFPAKQALFRYNRNNFLKYCLKQLITVKLKHGAQCIRVLGFTVFDSEKDVWK